MPYQLTCSLWLPLDREGCFRFFEDAHNLPRITPPWLGFHIVTKQIDLKPGCLIDYTVRWGLPMKWRTLIEAYDPPRYFIDRQLKGPYRLWHHQHRFTESAGGTLVEDEVTYLPPMGPLGRMMHWLMIGKNLRQIFEYRQQKIAEYLLGERAGEARVEKPTVIRWLAQSPVPLRAPAISGG